MESSLEEIDERVSQVLDILASKKYANTKTEHCVTPLKKIQSLVLDITGEWAELLEGQGHKAPKSRDHIFHIEIETRNVIDPHFVNGELAQQLDGEDLRNCQMYLNRVIDIARSLEGEYRSIQRESARVRLQRRRAARQAPPAPGSHDGAKYE